jgi:hypothetical protein
MIHQVGGSLYRCRLRSVTVPVMQTDMSFWESLVFADTGDLDVQAVTAAFGTVEVLVAGRAAAARCPQCGSVSEQVHDRDQRRVKDSRSAGRASGSS